MKYNFHIIDIIIRPGIIIIIIKSIYTALCTKNRAPYKWGGNKKGGMLDYFWPMMAY